MRLRVYARAGDREDVTSHDNAAHAFIDSITHVCMEGTFPFGGERVARGNVVPLYSGDLCPSVPVVSTCARVHLQIVYTSPCARTHDNPYL